jgi:hypothetical protein
MKSLVRCLVLFLAILASPGHATPPSLLWCDGCSDAQKKAAALTRPIGEQVYVGDAVLQRLDAYVVEATSLDMSHDPPTATRNATATAATSPYDEIGHALIEFHRAAPVGWSKQVNLAYAAAPSTNVYDVAFAGFARNILFHWISRQRDASFEQAGRETLGLFSAFRIVYPATSPAATFVVRFEDGSRITVADDFSTTIPNYDVAPDSAIDSHRNIIPLQAGHGSLPFDFSGPGNPDDQRRWTQWMTLLGYRVEATPGSRWSCANSTAGLRCDHAD